LQQGWGTIYLLNWAVIVSSATVCALMLPLRFPGVELLGVAPNWLLIWVVCWSVKRSMVAGFLAGIGGGWLLDGMTNPVPTHTLSLIVVGILTARLHKQRYLQEDFISIALIVFGMTLLAETIVALQFAFPAPSQNVALAIDKFVLALASQWTYHQQAALASAIVSSLWAPVVYYPLNRWWHPQPNPPKST
jgi:rod shape-determining protein MreD